MSALDDTALMGRIQAGEVDLFEQFVIRYRPALLRVACSKLGSEPWAEDVVQETFLAAFVARHTYRPQFQVRTWLWTILLNLCRKQWRRHAGRTPPVSLTQPGLPLDSSLITQTESGLAVLLSVERRREVHRLLNQLDEAVADALRLRFFGELPFEEIAATMGSSLSAAKQRVRRGLEQMAQLMQSKSGDLP